MANKENNESLAPLTFKLPNSMLLKIEEMIKNGIYKNRADLIRDAIQKLIDYELNILSVNER